MADPFEVRMRFTSLLSHLSASQTSSHKAASYALKHRDMDEDLHSCILEQLERNNLNSRANIMYFVEHLCDMATREDYPEFVRMVERDILKIVDAVAPEDGSGAANVKVVRKVLGGMGGKGYLSLQTVGELEDVIRGRDMGDGGEGGVSPMEVEGTRKETPRVKTNGSAAGKLDKRQIEQRIEEDRERHKRLRESIWAVDPEGDAEFERLWEETSDVGEDDFVLAAEEREERRKAARFWQLELQGTA